MIMERSTLPYQIAAGNAAKLLGACVTTIVDPDLTRRYSDLRSLGIILSSQSDLILLSTRHHNSMVSIAETCNVPIINMASNYQRPMEALAILLTVLEHYNKIKGLDVALIGCPNSTFHSLMCSFPRMGINLTLACTRDSMEMISPLFLDIAEEYCEHTKASLENCKSTREAVDGANVIIASGAEEVDLNTQCIDSFSCDWTFIQTFGRQKNSIHNFFLQHKNSLTPKFMSNLKYIYAATILRCLISNHKHLVPKPIF